MSSLRKSDGDSGTASRYGRLSSSTSSIRASSYSTIPRNYGSSLASYRPSNYTSAYTPSIRSNVSSDSTSSYSSSRSSGGYSGGGSSLTRSTSSSHARALYQSPANTRYSSGSSYTPSSTHHSTTLNTAPHSASTAPVNGTSTASSIGGPYNTAPSVTPRSRSSSAISSYRSINVRELNKQAAARADKDEKDKSYSEWLEREKMREQEAPLLQPMEAPPVRDFRKKPSFGCSTTASPGYSSFVRSVSSRSDVHRGTASSEIPPPPPEPPKYTSSVYKPIAAVHPMDDRESNGAPAVTAGFTGLRNIGNTCFMNATLQMLVNNVELKTYFLDKHFRLDVNHNNPLGFKGRLAEAFADFMRQMWNGQHRAVEPVKIKELVAEKASQFANFAQHDAHEFLSFLLDGLHEDLNRVKAKPITHTVDGDNREDIDVSSDAWRNHTLRNDSIFVDLFHGQLKSRLQCPKCDRVSITFDPFVYLAVPFPKVKKTINIHFWPLDPHLKPLKLQIQYPPDGCIQDMLSAISEITKVPSKLIRMIELFSHRIQKIFKADDKTSDICSGDVLYAFQLHDPADSNEEIVELYVIQRQLYSSTLRYSCNSCGKNEGSLKACEACYNAYYCNKECQLTDWSSGSHRDDCRRRSSIEAVGQPFVISLPKSQLTYSHLLRVTEPRSSCSVDVFQMPQVNGEESDAPSRSSSECSVKSEKKKGTAPIMFHISEKSSKKSTSPCPPSNTSRAGSTPRRQAVLPEARKKTDHKMYLLRKLPDQTHAIGETIMAGSGEPLDIPTGTYISMNWYNIRFGKPYINVDSKRIIDIDEEKSDMLNKLNCPKISSTNCSSGDPTLEEMLGMFSETERLKPEESWYCNKCKDHVEATKKLELYRLPPVLIVQLKRFVYTATYQTMHRRSKDERRVVYPSQQLDMRPYLANTAPAEQNTDYDLTGVVCHSGSSYFGHYISMGRLADFDSTKTKVDWRTFDDSIVSPLSFNSAQSDDAYLLFYKQRGTTTRSIFRRHYSCDPTQPLIHSEPNCKSEENGNLPLPSLAA